MEDNNKKYTNATYSNANCTEMKNISCLCFPLSFFYVCVQLWGKVSTQVKVLVAQLCLILCKPMVFRVGSHSLLHGIFPTQGSIPGLLHCRQNLYCLSHQGSPMHPNFLVISFLFQLHIEVGSNLYFCIIK